jgi:hypothetical protein
VASKLARRAGREAGSRQGGKLVARLQPAPAPAGGRVGRGWRMDGREAGRKQPATRFYRPRAQPSPQSPGTPEKEGLEKGREGNCKQAYGRKGGKLAPRSDAAVPCHASSPAPATRTSPDLD